MAKNMARIENGIVINIEWRSDKEPETENLKNYEGYSIHIGDTYSNCKFYHDGKEVLRDLELAYQKVSSLSAKNAELTAAIAQMVDDVYNQDVAGIQE